MKKLEHEGALPLIYAGRYGEEVRRQEIEKNQKEQLLPPYIPIGEQVTARPYVHVVGLEEIRVTLPKRQRINREVVPKLGASDKKRADNIGRAKRVVYDLIKCNDWDYFCTQTVNEKMLDRGDLHGLIKTMSRGVADQNKRVIHKAKKIRYIWVPELHSDGKSWHLHGVMSGLNEKDLRENDNGYLEWSWSADNVGFFSLSKIRSKERTASYVRKYITKNIESGGHRVNSHLYYCSKGLERPVVLGSEDILQTFGISEHARKNASHKVISKWAEVYTLQGKNAEKFMETWGSVLEVVR